MTRSHIKFLFITLATLVFMYFIQADKYIVDESLHFGQILTLMQGDNTHLPDITTFLVFHKLYAVLGQLIGLETLEDFRLISFALAGIMVFVLYFVCRDKDGIFDWILASQLFFLPIALPYYPLIYTDILALILLYLAYRQFTQNNHVTTALLTVMAVFIRQPSLVWLGLFLCLAFFKNIETYRLRLPLNQIHHMVSRIWPYVLSLLGFLVYFYYQGGVSLGDKQSHQVAINLTNIYFLIVVFALIFWPLFISRYKQVYQLLKRQHWITGVILICMPIYIITFSVTHHYNSPALNAFLRNWLLNHINDNLWFQFMTYGLSAYAVLAICTIKLKSKIWNWLYIFLPLSVIAMPLIEQRYYIVGMAFWQLSRTFVSSRIEFMQLLWMISFSLFLYIGLSQTWFYL